MLKKIIFIATIICSITLNAQQMNKMELDDLGIKMSSEAILMALYSETLEEIDRKNFSEKYNIPENDISQCIPYLLSNNYIKKSENLALTNLGIKTAKELSSNGVNVIGAKVENNSAIDVVTSEKKSAVIAGNEVTNNSTMKIDLSENEEIQKEKRGFKDYILFSLWSKWWGKLLLILGFTLFALFTVWKVLPDSTKEKLINSKKNQKMESNEPIIIQGNKVDNNSTLEIDASKNKTIKE